MRETLFSLGFATLLVHEMDAIARAEWRLLPILKNLDETTAFTSFLLLHIPLVALLISLCWNARRATRDVARLCVAAFMIVHVLLHLWFVDHPDYQFTSWLSQGIIYGAGALGAAYLLASLSLRRSG